MAYMKYAALHKGTEMQQYQHIDSSPNAIQFAQARNAEKGQEWLPDLAGLPVGMSVYIPGADAGECHSAAWRCSQGQLRYRAFNHGHGVEIARLPDWTPLTGEDTAQAVDCRPQETEQAQDNQPVDTNTAQMTEALEQANAQQTATVSPGADAFSAPVGNITDAGIDRMHSEAHDELNEQSSMSEPSKAQMAAIEKVLREYYQKDFAFVAKAKTKTTAKMHNDHVVSIEYIGAKVGTLAAFKKEDTPVPIIVTAMSMLTDENKCVPLEGETAEWYESQSTLYGLYSSII